MALIITFIVDRDTSLLSTVCGLWLCFQREKKRTSRLFTNLMKIHSSNPSK